MDQALEIKFLKKLGSDKSLQTELSKCKSPEEALAAAKKAGFDVSFDDFKKSMGKLNFALNKKKGELTENDLEMVAGGRASYRDVMSGVHAGASVGGAAAAAA